MLHHGANGGLTLALLEGDTVTIRRARWGKGLKLVGLALFGDGAAHTVLRTHRKAVRANSSISAILSPYYPFLEERAMLGVIDDAVVLHTRSCEPIREASLHKFEQHFQDFTVFVWKNTGVKRNHLI